MPPCLCLDMWRVICVNVNTKIQHAPSMYHKWERLDYGVKKKCASNESNKPILPPKDTKYIQMLVGNFLYYDIAVEPTMLLAWRTLAPEQLKTIKRNQRNSETFTWLMCHKRIYQIEVEWNINYCNSSQNTIIKGKYPRKTYIRWHTCKY